jgi:hypothetical protein
MRLDVPVPSPMPAGGGLVAGWTCNDRTSPSPSPVPLSTPVAVPVRVGQDCAVSSWATPYPTQPVTVTVTATYGNGPVTVTGVDGPPALAAGFLVFFAAAAARIAQSAHVEPERHGLYLGKA